MSRVAAKKKSLKKPSRSVSAKSRAYLFARSAGRCEFDGCPAYLLEHYPTFTPDNFAEMAHIWSFSDDGPRGNDGIDKAKLNEFENLILLCSQCHKLVDGDCEKYTVEVLRRFKRAHEDLIFHRTGLRKDSHTVAVRLLANIAGQKPVVTLPQMQRAVAPLFLSDRAVQEIDLTSLQDRVSGDYLRLAAEEIKVGVDQLYRTNFNGETPTHISVFALAPIPLLIFLGSCLNNKIATNLFQRHRDTEDWCWKESGPLAMFSFSTLQAGRDASCVALMLSLSGRIHRSDLPVDVDERFTVYELWLSSAEPNTHFLGTRQDLESFRASWELAIREMKAVSKGLTEIYLFPAVPAPVAVAMGRDLLPKVDPKLIIYDNNKRAGGFVRTIEANSHDQ